LAQTQVRFTVRWATEVTLWPATTVYCCNPIKLSHMRSEFSGEHH
jgi:NADH:ubiquinone oxidoreductase subunit B-like Fe-S oxidoreductase